MNTNINLLLQTDGESLKRQKRARRLNFIAITFLVVIGGISIFLFLTTAIVNPSAIVKEQNAVIEQMAKEQNKQAKFFILNNRTDNIEKILQKRLDLGKVTDTLLTKIPAGLSIEDLEVDNKQVFMTAQSSSLLAIGELIVDLTDMVRKKEIIKSLTLTTLVFDEGKNSYQVSIKSQL